MRPTGYRDEAFAHAQPHLLLGVLQEEPHLAFQHIERVADVRVEVPGHGLRRRQLQLADAETRPLGVAVAAFDLIEMAGVLHRLELAFRFHGPIHLWSSLRRIVPPIAPPRYRLQRQGLMTCPRLPPLASIVPP